MRMSVAAASPKQAREEAQKQAQMAAEQQAFFEYVIKEEMQPCWPFILGQDVGTALGWAKPAFTVRTTRWLPRMTLPSSNAVYTIDALPSARARLSAAALSV